jgi:nucleoside-diphosphate-sugar epimerase
MRADVSVAESCVGLPRDCDWVVLCISSKGGGASEYERTYLQSTRNLIDLLAKQPPARFVYTSSTSVYGQNDGSLVDETTPPRPESLTAQVLLQTEALLTKAATERGFPAVVLRVGGIYGPNRTHWIDRVRNGLPELDLRSERIVNMIHRDDVAGAVFAALERGRPGAIYNAVDDEPASQTDFVQWLSEKLGRPSPLEGSSGTAKLGRRAVTSKRVSNRKLKEELGYRFRFPTFREGYSAGLV